MFKSYLYAVIIVFATGCCSSTKTYDNFTKEQEQLLHYLEGQHLVYYIDNTDSINLYVANQYIGNLPPGEFEDTECDAFYPAYGKATLKAVGDTSILFYVSIKKKNNVEGISEKLEWMNYTFDLEDTTGVTFYDSLNLRHLSAFNNVYEMTVADTLNSRPDLIHKVFFSIEYGIIRFDRKDGRVYRLKI